LPSQQLLDVSEAFIEQMRDVFVVERVIGNLALLPESQGLRKG
jgi:hypothetical protein